MQNKKSFSGKNFSVLLLGTLIFSSCAPVNTSPVTEKSSGSVKSYKDWTADRIYKNTETNSFNTKSSLKVNPGIDQSMIDNIPLMNALSGQVSAALNSMTLTGTNTLFTQELRAGDRIYLKLSKEVYEIDSIESDTSLTFTFPVATAITNSDFEITGSKNLRAKSFGSGNVAFNPSAASPSIDFDIDNDDGAFFNRNGTIDDVLFFTSDNTSGSNFFAVNSDLSVRWERVFDGKFSGNSPTFSGKLIAGKKIMYLASTSGHIYCIDTDGRVISTMKVSDGFENTSVWVDSTDPARDYIYAASRTGNFYRFKLDVTNPQTQTLSMEYSNKIASTGFSSSPVLNNTSVFIGGENGIFYEIVPNTGDVARSWNLSAYHNNGAGSIKASPFFSGNIAIVPSGGYLFRIENSNVTQSPLLELKEGINSGNQAFGSVFRSNYFPSGAITSAPVFDPFNNNVYISNGNAVFEINLASINSFETSARYCASVSGRISSSGKGLLQSANGTIALSRVGGVGVTKLVMVDVNEEINSTPFLNYFTVPFPANADGLERYMSFNDFDSKGFPVRGANSRVIADNSGNVYFSLDNGTVSSFPIP